MMASQKSRTIEDLVTVMKGGSYEARCSVLRDLCPCRNNRNREYEVWREIFNAALKGGMRERNQAAHAIGTLIDKAARSNEWREVLHQCRDLLDEVMLDPRASRSLLGQMKKHGHAHRGAAIQSYRRSRRDLDLATPVELTQWLNRRLKLSGRDRVQASDPGVRRLWRWQKHRVEFQPERKTRDDELLTRAERYLPQLFGQ